MVSTEPSRDSDLEHEAAPASVRQPPWLGPKGQSEPGAARSSIRLMTSITTPLDTPRQDPRTRERATAHLLTVTTLVEGGFGVALLVAPVWVARVLAGVNASPELAAVMRVAGGIALTIAAWCALGRLSETGPPRSRPLDLVPGLVVYNGCAVAVIADAVLRGIRAPLLGPALAVHSALLVWCIVCLAREHTARALARRYD
jgi:hypothetical protein